VPKKCIHILRDIYVKCVYIFLAPSVFFLIPLGTQFYNAVQQTTSPSSLHFSQLAPSHVKLLWFPYVPVECARTVI